MRIFVASAAIPLFAVNASLAATYSLDCTGGTAGPISPAPAELTTTPSAPSVSDTLDITNASGGTLIAITSTATNGVAKTTNSALVSGSATGPVPAGPLDISANASTATQTYTKSGAGDASFSVTLTRTATSGAAKMTWNATCSGPPTATIANTTNAAEPATDGLMTVTLSSASVGSTVVSYSVSGTATAGTDYTALSGSVTIPNGATTATITIPVLDDSLVEGPESVIVTLTSATNSAVIGSPSSATNTIADDDGATVSIANTADAAEPATDGVMTLTLSATSASPTTVSFTVGGAATAGSDYTAFGASAVIPANTLSTTITIPVLDDLLVEGPETVIVTLTGTDNPLITVGAPSSATNTIADDDGAAFNVSKSSVTVSETGTSETFTVVLGTAPGSNVVITLTASDLGEATVSPTSMTFTPGNWSVPQTATVTGVDDSIVDGDVVSTVTVSVDDANSDDAFDPLADQIVTVTTLDDEGAAEFTAQLFSNLTTAFMARRLDLIATHGPTLNSLVRRGGPAGSTAPNGFRIASADHAIRGDFALSLSGIARAGARRPGAFPASADDNAPSRPAFLEIWIEGEFVVFDDAANAFSEEGDFLIFHTGADLRVSDRLILGVMTEVDWTDQESSAFNSKLDGVGWMAGPYLSAEAFDGVFFDLRAMFGRSNNTAEADSLGSRFRGEFDTNRWLVHGAVSGRVASGALTVTPEASLIYLEESHDAYAATDGITTVIVPEGRAELGRFNAGAQMSYVIVSDGPTVEPFIRGRVLWDFDRTGELSFSGFTASQAELRGVVGAGLSVAMDGAILRFEGSYDGVGADGYDSFSAKASIGGRF
jgi:hypothetical protein